MQKINIHEAKTKLSRLVDDVVENGDSFIIAKAGKPMVKVVRINAPAPQKIQRLGFLKNQIVVPDDFDRMGEDKIDELFMGSV
jgi:prevent-host-death family protein